MMKTPLLDRQAVSHEMGEDWADAIAYYHFILSKQFGQRAEDILSESVARAWESFDSSKAGVKTYLKQVIRSVIGRSKAKSGRDKRIPSYLICSADAPMADDDSTPLWAATADDDAPIPDDRAMVREELTLNVAALDKAMARLSDKERIALELIYFEDERQNAAAKIMGLTPERVRQLRNSGLEKLKAKML